MKSAFAAAATRAFITVFVPLMVLMGINLHFLVQQELGYQRTTISNRSDWAIKTAGELISDEFRHVIADARFLAQSRDLPVYIEAHQTSSRTSPLASLAKEFAMLLSVRTSYDQIRLLDSEGMEIVRVNQNHGAPQIVPSQELQYKGDRYYFADTVALPPSGVYISPFDLNIERGVIERPVKPTIRFGVPIYDTARRIQGAIIINYLGAELLHRLTQIGDEYPIDVYLLNQDGYWLTGPSDSVEWGFMGERDARPGVWDSFPQVWEEMRAGSFEGTISTENGIATYGTISPLLPGWWSSTGARGARGTNDPTGSLDSYRWLLMAVAPPTLLPEIRQELMKSMASTVVIYTVVAAIFAAIVAFYGTNRARSKRDLEESEAQLRRSNSTKDKLFSILAHDLRGPLASIASLSEMVADDLENQSPADLREVIEAIRDAAQGEYQLLTTLLTWSQSQLEKIKFQPSYIHLGSLLTDTIRQIAPAARSKSVTILGEVPSDGETLFADEDMIQVVLRNLLSNAVKFTPEGGAVTVSAEFEGTTWTISIGDTGIGIPEEHLGALFCVENTFRRRGTSGEASTGLGLILCKEFVEKNGGTINAASTVGQGSVFSVVLPGAGGSGEPEKVHAWTTATPSFNR